MSHEPSAVEQAVSRAVRDSLAALQRNAEEFNQALSDLVASCSSSRPVNSLSPALRAQMAAASLAASLEAMARFVAAASAGAVQIAAEAAPVVTLPAPAAPAPIPEPVPAPIPTPMAEAAPAPVVEAPPPPPAPVMEAPPQVAEVAPAPVEVAATRVVEETEMAPPTVEVVEAPAPPPEAAPVEAAPVAEVPPPPAPAPPPFDVSALPPEQQELHRRANRAAKVSMQDIKLLKPKEVKLGQENADICIRLREDIDKARKEYDRRFKAILDHPVDYFYQWMVEILADGKAELLGEYPYPSPTARR